MLDLVFAHEHSLESHLLVKKKPGRRDRNALGTHAALIAAGRRAFSTVGFAEASLDEIVARAGVTTGAVYHHFDNKKGLFRAVAESIEQEILDSVKACLEAASDRPPWEQLEIGLSESLDLCSAPGVARILFSDAPNVIGVREWREIEVEYGFGLLGKSLALLEEAGELRPGSAEVSGKALLGALMEAAHAVAAADDREAVLQLARQTLNSFLSALKPDEALRSARGTGLP